MTRVSAVLPSLGDTTLLERNLPPLLAELERCAAGDEVVVVDDTGEAVLGPWLAERHPTVRVVTRSENGGFAAALTDGARAAEGELLLALHPDVRVRAGFLEPLVAALDDEEVFAASPRVLAAGGGAPESHNALRYEDGRLTIVPREADPEDRAPRPVAFPCGCAFLARRAELLERGGFDPLFQPFRWEDVDLGLGAWRSGRSVLEVPAAVVEHGVEAGTLAAAVPEELLQAATEKNRLLVLWKYLDERRDAHDHLAALWRDALDAGMAGRRRELIWMALALQELPRVSRSRKAAGAPVRPIEQVLRISDPLA